MVNSTTATFRWARESIVGRSVSTTIWFQFFVLIQLTGMESRTNFEEAAPPTLTIWICYPHTPDPRPELAGRYRPVRCMYRHVDWFHSPTIPSYPILSWRTIILPSLPFCRRSRQSGCPHHTRIDTGAMWGVFIYVFEGKCVLIL